MASITTFASANEFLNSEQVDDNSCLITDVQMPGLSGIELQGRLIAGGHRIPIIFIMGYSDNTVRIRALKSAALAFLSKPINHHHLIGRWRDIVTLKKLAGGYAQHFVS